MIDTLLIGIGIVGTLIQIGTYFLVSSGRMSSNDGAFYWWNLIGTSCIVASLYVQWNFPSLISQVLWIVVSIIGIVRTAREKNA